MSPAWFMRILDFCPKYGAFGSKVAVFSLFGVDVQNVPAQNWHVTFC